MERSSGSAPSTATGIATDAPEAVRPHGRAPVRRPFSSRVSTPQLLMVVAGTLAFLTNLVLLRGGEERVQVVVAAADLVPGTELEEGTSRLVELDSGSDLVAALITAAELETLRGRPIRTRVAEGDPIPENALGDPLPGAGLRALSIPVERERAVGGGLRPGDLVDVISVEAGIARYVLTGAEVVSLPEEGGGLSPGRFHLVVEVDADQALEVARAVAVGPVDVVRSTGSEPPARRSIGPGLGVG